MNPPLPHYQSPACAAVLERIQRASRRSIPRLVTRLVVDYKIRRKPFEQAFPTGALLDVPMAISPDEGEFLYQIVRARRARLVVEFGTSFGVSTIYLAAAVRDTVREHGGDGVVIGTEIEPTKASVAKANVADAGLADFVDVRVGDARETLKQAGGPVDFLLLDSWIPLVRPVIDVVGPQLRVGAMVVCDNVQLYEREYAAYTALVRDPKNGFRSVMLSHEGGLEISIKLG